MRQFHFRLAQRLGVIHPDSLVLDRLTPDQFSEWVAIAVIDGWFQGDWTHTAHLLSTIHNSAVSQLAADGKISASNLTRNMIDPQEYIEANISPKKRKPRGNLNPQQLADQLAKADKWQTKN